MLIKYYNDRGVTNWKDVFPLVVGRRDENVTVSVVRKYLVERLGLENESEVILYIACSKIVITIDHNTATFFSNVRCQGWLDGHQNVNHGWVHYFYFLLDCFNHTTINLRYQPHSIHCRHKM